MERRGSRRESQYYGFSYGFLNHWLPREPLNEEDFHPRGEGLSRDDEESERGSVAFDRRKKEKKKDRDF